MSVNGAQGRVWLARTEHGETLGARVTSECLFANSDVDGWGRLCIKAYLSLSAGFLSSRALWWRLAEGLTYSLDRFDQHVLVFTASKERV